MSKRIVIALGGNALGNTAAEQLQLVTETAKAIVDLIQEGHQVVVAHGNGPQVGMINLGLSTAAEAKAIGLDSEVYPAEELMDKAMELANAICANAQIAVCESKRCIRMGMQTDIATGSAFEAEAFGVCFGTEDQTEGMSAFLEKRAEKHFQNK